jgi:hypothetical protein
MPTHAPGRSCLWSEVETFVDSLAHPLDQPTQVRPLQPYCALWLAAADLERLWINRLVRFLNAPRKTRTASGAAVGARSATALPAP